MDAEFKRFTLGLIGSRNIEKVELMANTVEDLFRGQPAHQPGTMKFKLNIKDVLVKLADMYNWTFETLMERRRPFSEICMEVDSLFFFMETVFWVLVYRLEPPKTLRDEGQGQSGLSPMVSLQQERILELVVNYLRVRYAMAKLGTPGLALGVPKGSVEDVTEDVTDDVPESSMGDAPEGSKDDAPENSTDDVLEAFMNYPPEGSNDDAPEGSKDDTPENPEGCVLDAGDTAEKNLVFRGILWNYWVGTKVHVASFHASLAVRSALSQHHPHSTTGATARWHFELAFGFSTRPSPYPSESWTIILYHRPNQHPLNESQDIVDATPTSTATTRSEHRKPTNIKRTFVNHGDRPGKNTCFGAKTSERNEKRKRTDSTDAQVLEQAGHILARLSQPRALRRARAEIPSP
ncbi:hypothetical protein V8F20_008623 [Naviculisporaceae sp. PSN 640]